MTPQSGQPASRAGTFRALFASTRPRQWTKNLVVFAPAIFSGLVAKPQVAGRASVAFLALCLASGAVYLMNDVHDRDRDAHHPEKRQRAIASGRLSARTALIAAAALAAAALGAGLLVGAQTAGWVAAFLALQIVYTFVARSIAYVDAVCISSGFVVRVAAGGAAVGVPLSAWMLVNAALLAFLLALGKRRHEVLVLESAYAHRPAAAGYRRDALEAVLRVTAFATVFAYGAWTFFPGYMRPTAALTASTLFVALGVLRYLVLVHRDGLGGSPEELLLTDAPLIVDLVAWGVTLAFALYGTVR